MEGITSKEMEVVLVLLKDYGKDYNANNLSKLVGLTPMGALKILKRLEGKRLLVSRQMGKAVFYKPDYGSEYSLKYLSFLLMKESDESQPKVRRWVAELRILGEHAEIGVLFGSVLSKENPEDIDLLLVLAQRQNDKVNDVICSINKLNLRKIHTVKQSRDDLIENMKKKDKVVVNALKNGVVVFGHEKLIKVIGDVSR
ncbi:MAG: hypothetical protein V1744_03135 [Candidatus Altiarchaeota archaeon]